MKEVPPPRSQERAPHVRRRNKGEAEITTAPRHRSADPEKKRSGTLTKKGMRVFRIFCCERLSAIEKRRDSLVSGCNPGKKSRAHCSQGGKNGPDLFG